MSPDREAGADRPTSEEPPSATEKSPADRTGAGCAPDPERRRFLHRASLGIGLAVAAALGIPWVTFLLSPARREDPTAWRRVGRVEDFPVGGTVKATYLDAAPLPWAGFAAETAAWIRREDEGSFIAFSVYCTHVGCPVRWEEGAELFMCPCHGGAFYRDGSVAAGPPPQPLVRYPTRLRDGYVEVQTVGVPRPRRVL